MLKIYILFFSVALLGSCKSSAGGPSELSIVGGKETKDYPAVMGFIAYAPQDKYENICTATLIRPDVLITAAHCVDPNIVGEDAQFEVYTGYDLFTKGAWGQKLVPRQVIYDRRFDRSRLESGHDLALVFLDEKLAIRPVTLLNQKLNENLLKDAHLVILGYGLTSTRDQLSSGTKRILKTNVTNASGSILKAGKRGQGTCTGDSGGPVFTTVDGVETLIGIVSYGNMDCSGESYVSRVDDGFDFLQSRLGN